MLFQNTIITFFLPLFFNRSRNYPFLIYLFQTDYKRDTPVVAKFSLIVKNEIKSNWLSFFSYRKINMSFSSEITPIFDLF